jgi:hypothetical protein
VDGHQIQGNMQWPNHLAIDVPPFVTWLVNVVKMQMVWKLILMCYIFLAVQIVLAIHTKTCGHTKIIIELMIMKGAWHMWAMIVGRHAYSTKVVSVLFEIKTL